MSTLKYQLPPSISRATIRTLCLCVVFLMLHSFASAQEAPPNIIFVLTDDQRWDALGAAGNDIIQTPEMDKLASEGTRFTQAYVTTPICAASRATILTGLYERTHGFTFRTPPMSKQLARETYPAVLKDAGYTTGFVGKLGVKMKKDYEEKIFDFISRPAEKGRWRGHYYAMMPDHTHKHISEEIGDQSLQFIDRNATQGPFCLSISFHSPHADDQMPHQYIYPEHLRTLYNDVEIPRSDLATDSFFDNQYDSVQTGLNHLRWLWRFDTPEKYQRMVKGYYRMITGVDIQLGRIREALQKHGIAHNTVIIFMADNGYFLDERKLAGKWLMYDNCLKVPLIIYDPRRTSAPKTSDAMALNIDIAPTILNLAGLSVPDTQEGENLFELASGQGKQREYFLCEHLFDHEKIPRSEGIRTKTSKYFRYVDRPSWEEFYDLTADPEEKDNQIHHQSHENEIRRLRELLDREIQRLKSP